MIPTLDALVKQLERTRAALESAAHAGYSMGKVSEITGDAFEGCHHCGFDWYGPHDDGCIVKATIDETDALLAALAASSSREGERTDETELTKATALIRDMVEWHARLSEYQHEQLVLGQSLESASRNWETMDNRGFDMAPMHKWLAARDATDAPRGGEVDGDG